MPLMPDADTHEPRKPLVLMRTTRQEHGMLYTVEGAAGMLYSRFVPFGMKAHERAGGASFIEAAHEQEAAAAKARAGA